eukprot:CAMPEP_0172474852 /NCGR_PEP_ID=MMETSP1065-20121228/69570_1 /TAXON_ID=265537 /ORGANISM="Amphiprora paludosa, Strain CCMP125" /LENGTH=760 /DNA_ID=CAMNT_0013233043 /DNA_START=1831 /DNA_END=4113 /DNA_ORIENTATION=-
MVFSFIPSCWLPQLAHPAAADPATTPASSPQRQVRTIEQRIGTNQEDPLEQRDDVEIEPNAAVRVDLEVRTTPETPEGLRSRASISALRKELQLAEPRSQQSRPFLVEKKAHSNSLLPPAPSSSWSIPRDAHQRVVNSPQVSLSGFYGDQSSSKGNQSIALSPHLLPGQARTAVGALVAKQQINEGTQNHPPLLAAASSASTAGYEGDADGHIDAQENLQVIPPFHDWAEKGFEEAPQEEEEGRHYEDAQPYYPLDKDPVQLSRTPPRPNTRIKQYISPMTVGSSFLGQSPSSITRKSLDTSLAASPSSLMGHKFLETSTVPHPIGARGDSSTSSRVGLIPADKREHQGYDFGLLEEAETSNFAEVVLADASDQTHISAMSLSLPDADKHGYDEFPSIAEDEDYDDSADESLQSRNIENQRRSREDLVLAAVERLQDDIQLVSQVEEGGIAITKEMNDWFVKTEVEKEGILTGFTLENRKALSTRLAAVLNEMNSMAQPEDYLVLSPSELPRYSETHTDLYQALSFCRSLVHMAIPPLEQKESMQNPCFQGKWKIDDTLYKAMSLIPASPDTTKRYGGDSSVFTLPSADTPMTSNLSVSSAHKGWSSEKRVHAESAQVRKTIEIVATLVEKLSVACRQWLESGSSTEHSVKVTRDIKRHYLQLVGISYDDLSALVHAFDLVKESSTTCPMPSIAPLVSNDEDDVHESQAPLRSGNANFSQIEDDDEFTAVKSQDMESLVHCDARQGTHSTQRGIEVEVRE